VSLEVRKRGRDLAFCEQVREELPAGIEAVTVVVDQDGREPRKIFPFAVDGAGNRRKGNPHGAGD